MSEHKIQTYAPYAYRGHCPTGSVINGCKVCGICWGISPALVETRGSQGCDCQEQQTVNATHNWELFETPVGPPELGETHDGWVCQRCGAVSHHKMMTAYADKTCTDHAMRRVLE